MNRLHLHRFLKIYVLTYVWNHTLAAPRCSGTDLRNDDDAFNNSSKN